MTVNNWIRIGGQCVRLEELPPEKRKKIAEELNIRALEILNYTEKPDAAADKGGS